MRAIRKFGSMRGVWKRSQGRATKAPPDERGGNRHARPNAIPRHTSTYNFSRPEGANSGRVLTHDGALHRVGGRPQRSKPVFSNRVLSVKFCKGGHGWLESCGLAELNFLVLFEIVHIEIAVGFEPVLVGLDG